MKPKKYSALSDDWQVNLETAEFLSPAKDSGPNQMVIFSDQMKSGTMAGSFRPLTGQLDPNWGDELRECAFLFRYGDKEHFYVTGIGGFGMKFFIAKVLASEWRLLDGTGLARSLKADALYHVRVEFTGDRITLFHNDVPILNVSDSTYASGFCGLCTNRTEARFERVDIETVRPKCFVIMPFEAELE